MELGEIRRLGDGVGLTAQLRRECPDFFSTADEASLQGRSVLISAQQANLDEPTRARLLQQVIMKTCPHHDDTDDVVIRFALKGSSYEMSSCHCSYRSRLHIPAIDCLQEGWSPSLHPTSMNAMPLPTHFSPSSLPSLAGAPHLSTDCWLCKARPSAGQFRLPPCEADNFACRARRLNRDK